MESMYRCVDGPLTKVFQLEYVLLIVTLSKQKLYSCIQTVKLMQRKAVQYLVHIHV